MRRWDAQVDGYLKWCEGRGLAEETINGRMRELDRYGVWLKRRRPRPNLEEVDGDLVIRYIRSRTAFHSKSTVCGVITTLRCIGEHLVREGIWRKNPMRWIRGPKLNPMMRLPRRIGKEQLRRIWDAACSIRQVYHRHLMMSVLSILYGTGLRRGEIERLDLSDWNRVEGILKIDGQKTGQERHVPVGEGVWKCMEAYLPYRHNVLEKTGSLDEGALFINRYGERLGGAQIGNLVHRLAKRTKVPLVTLHQFRHSCASDLLESGVSLPEVQKILGHAAINSTLRYTQIADPERKHAMEKHPINGILTRAADSDRRAA